MSKFKDWLESKNKSELKYLCSCARGRAFRMMFEAGQKAGPDWIPVSTKMPESGVNVLVRGVDENGYDVKTTAIFYNECESEATEDTDIDYCDYNGVDDKFYLSKGWHSAIDGRTIDYAIDFTVTDWQPLPEVN